MEFAPSAEIGVLKKRAQLVKRVRRFLDDRGVVEVNVPSLGRYPVTDPRIECLKCTNQNQDWFLQSSPEYFMKRLLAAGSGPIYYLGQAFRAEQTGRLHRQEFTMLEWYRPAWTEQDLIDEVFELLIACNPGLVTQKTTYRALFEEHLGLCPHVASIQDLKSIALSRINFDAELDTKSDWLDLLFTHCVEPKLPSGATAVYDFPKEQCALARIAKTAEGIEVAKRFECYWNGVEIANGYWELTDASEQKQRFESDCQQRYKEGKFVPAIDPAFMAAIDFGLPECSGVALGFDRMAMIALGEQGISSVMAFADG